MKNNLVLYQFPHGRRIANLSPFCLKVETFLRMADIPYTIKPTLNVSKGPTHKLPYIDYEGQKMGDSSQIIQNLVQRHQITWDEQLSVQERAVSLSVQRMLEESTYFAMVWTRWIDPNVSPHWFKLIGSSIPRLLRKFVLRRLQKKVFRQLYEQGTGRLKPELIDLKAKGELDALATLFGEGPYFFKDRMTSIDACIYAFCAEIYTLPHEASLRAHLYEKENLIKFIKRMHEKYYPDFMLSP